jgi:hypothetical protein
MRLIRPSFALAAITLTMCGSEGGTDPNPAISALVSSAVVLVQGQSAIVSVTVSRSGGYAGTIALAVSGLPPGVSATFDPAVIAAGTGAGTATLTLTATAAATAGAAAFTVTASGSGVANATASGSSTVNPAPSVQWKFCDLANLPLHVAFQNIGAPWSAVTGSPATDGPTYTFTLTAATGGVAFVQGNAQTSGFRVSVFHGTRAELQAFADHHCAGNPHLPRTLGYSVAGVAPTDWTFLVMGSEFGSMIGNANSQINQPASGAADLIATRATSTPAPALTFTPVKMIIRRGVNIPSGSIPVLDFGAAEAFDPVTAQLTLQNLGGDQVVPTVFYRTSATPPRGPLYLVAGSSNSVHTVYGVPAARQLPADLHALDIITVGTGVGRSHTVWLKSLTNTTISLGEPLSAPAFSSIAATPYPRYRATGPIQATYDDSFEFLFSQNGAGGGDSRAWSITAARGYLSGSGYSLDVPDLSGTVGWQSQWAPRAGELAGVVMIASGFSSNGTVPPSTEGAVVRSARVIQSVVP